MSDYEEVINEALDQYDLTPIVRAKVFQRVIDNGWFRRIIYLRVHAFAAEAERQGRLSCSNR